VPPFFLLYLLSVPAIVLFAGAMGKWLLLPLAFYAFAVLAQVAVLTMRASLVRSVATLPLIMATHVLYGFGFWRGLFTTLQPGSRRTPVQVFLETINLRQEASPQTPNSATRQQS
jgi:hypothetical protein